MTVQQYYEDGYDEDARLDTCPVEWLRNTELIARVLPAAPVRIADIAGGTGRYAAWLAEQGHQVSMLDLVPTHVEQARKRAASRDLDIDCVVGDARALPWADETFDVVMVMGALYHLQDRADRLACLAQAHRVLKPEGRLITSYISRWASLIDGYRSGFVTDPEFRQIIATDLLSGKHENPARKPHWFTTSYFHTPDEVMDELATTGFDEIHVLPVEGFASAVALPENLSDDELATLMDHISTTENEPALLGVSAHWLSLSRRPL